MALWRIGFLCLACAAAAAVAEPQLGSTRVVFQTKYGDIEFGFYPDVAPVTVEHIFKLVRLGAYNTNHFFRVDKGFVAQVADVVGGRKAPLNEAQMEEGKKTIKGEFSDVKHVRGILSMGRYSDPNSAQSSFSILLGSAPHLDREYAVFGKVTKGFETLELLQELPTKREGIFVMPQERVTILSTYYYDVDPVPLKCEDEVSILRRRLIQASNELEEQRMRCLP
ncbi:peptidyl-prolyl cis-trans isomerase CYP23 [Selaginella moellendorffii]|uniref:peptidyl-prolyl cis-trans isomerase CYP23 n=1 Tax=Selaginella moellendorffii TaxID=88036 RepID=UPI000D1C7E8B|nr:peptidyl-prolyl cis-trans isomerase CYP23 [Selaginella moellendorffii]|eukprot:XP_024532294.1 peptidyl-prolyl cis-trans isomerase CYP23 [Selaginella moellendorffii]